MRKTKRLALLTGLVLTAALGIGAAVVQPWVTPRHHALVACDAFAHAGFGNDHISRGTSREDTRLSAYTSSGAIAADRGGSGEELNSRDPG